MRSLRATLCGQALKSCCLVGLWMAFGGCSPSGSSSSKSSLRINEAMANNDLALTDESGRILLHDWVELYNAGGETLSLNGVTLSDNPNRPRKFRFPVGLRVAPGEFLVVQIFDQGDCETRCDEKRLSCQDADATAVSCQEFDFDECMNRCNPPGFVADFDFAGGETIYLFADDGDSLIDRLGVASLGPNVSVGRYPDGNGPFGVIHPGSVPGSGATPGWENLVTDTLSPSVTLAPAGFPDCGEDVEIGFDVIVDADQTAEPSVALEYLLETDGGAADTWVPVELMRGEEVTIEESREDINGELRPVERRSLAYSGTIPAPACVNSRASRRFRVRVVQGSLPATVATSRVDWTAKESRPTVAINEYVPRNTELRFTYEQRDAAPVFERPDWLELYNYGPADVDISNWGLTGIGRWKNFVAGDRETLDPWILRDPDVDNPDDTPDVSVPDVILQAGCFLVILTDGDGGDRRRTYRLVDEFDMLSEDAFEGRLDCQLPDTTGKATAIFRSTNFRLDARERVGGDPDGFVLVRPDDAQPGQWILVDLVEIDFNAIRAQGDEFLEETNSGKSEIKANVAFGRAPSQDETFEEQLGLGNILCVPTPGADNTLLCEVPPRFREELSIVPRNPRAGEVVRVTGRVNFDTGKQGESETAPSELMVSLRYRIGDAIGVLEEPAEFEKALDQDDAAAASTLWDFVFEIPGQPDGTFVTFSLQAHDTVQGGEAVLEHREDSPLSFRYVVGFEPGLDGPVINEVLPNNDNTPLPPFENVTDPKHHDYVEVYNPGIDALDLGGYYLAQSLSPLDPIARARRWRFPDGISIVPPGGFLVVYFGSPPDPAPEDYVEADFGLDACREALYLIAPDEPERGANSIVSSVSWSFEDPDQPDVPCPDDVSIVPLCGSEGDLTEVTPTPGRANFQAPEFHGAYHSDLFGTQKNQCIPLGPQVQVNLNAVVLVDAQLAGKLDAVGNQPGAILDEQRIVVELEDGSEDAKAGALTYCGASGGPCAPAPDGRIGIHIQRLVSRSGIDAQVIRYRVEVRDACGNTLEAGPFSVGIGTGEKPTLSINEINLSSALPDDPDTPRSWVELTNRSPDVEWDAGGMFITDNPFFPQKASVPEGTVIAPGGFAVVPLDESFDLAEVSGTLALIDSVERGSCELETFAFDFRGVELGRSLGRLPDGTGAPAVLDTPSPGAGNASDVLFIRGDVTEDGVVDAADVDRLSAILVGGGEQRPRCDDALDVDDSGAINISDLIALAGFLGGGPSIPPPFPEPGTDPTPDELTCD